MSNAIHSLRLLLAVVALTLAAQAHAAVDMFIAFEDPGTPDLAVATETLDKYIEKASGCKGICDAKSINLGIENPIKLGSATGGAGAGKASFKEIVVEMDLKASLNKLFMACVLGSHYKKVTLIYRKAGGASATLKPYFKIELGTVLITNAAMINEGDDPPRARVTLRCASIKQYLWKQKADGSLIDPPTITMWNQTTNTAE